MHLDIYELICSKLDLMIHTIELHILILVLMTLTFIHGQKNARRQKLHQLPHNVLHGF